MRALVIAEVSAGRLKASVPSLVSAAQKAAKAVDLFLLGQAQEAVDEAASLDGVETVFVNPEDGENILSESLTKAVAVKASNYSHIFFESSSMGKSVMPRVAASLDVAPLSDVIAVVDAETFVRPIFAGSIEVTVRNEEPIKVASIRATAFDPVSKNGNAQVVLCDPMPEAMKTRKVSFEAVKTIARRCRLRAL